MASVHAGSEKPPAGAIAQSDGGYLRPPSQYVSASDPESGFDGDAHLLNTTVRHFSWAGVTVTVKDRVTKELRNIVDDVEGTVEAGKFPSNELL